MFESVQPANESLGIPETLGLIQFLKAVLVAQVIIVLIATMSVRARDAAVLFVVNAGLTLVKAALIFALIRALKRGSRAACWIVLAAAVTGFAYILATFRPDDTTRYLKMESFQYVVNVFNLIMAALGAFLTVRTLRSLLNWF